MSHYYEEFGLRIVAWAGNGKQRAELMSTCAGEDKTYIGTIFSDNVKAMIVPFEDWEQRSDDELLAIMYNGDPDSINAELLDIGVHTSPHDYEQDSSEVY